MEKQLVDEEKAERARIRREAEDLKKLKLVQYEEKLKKGEGKGNFEDLLDEYTAKRKEVEKDINEDMRTQEMNLLKRLDEKRQKKQIDIAEQRRKNEMDLDKKAGGVFSSIKSKIDRKIKLLDNEVENPVNEEFDQER